jgi:hypothetical protein
MLTRFLLAANAAFSVYNTVYIIQYRLFAVVVLCMLLF